MTGVRASRWLLVSALVGIAVLLVAAGCGRGRWPGAAISTTTTSAATTTPSVPVGTGGAVAAPDPNRPECSELLVLLKLDITDEDRTAVGKKLRSIPEVASFRFQPSAPQSQTVQAFHVRPVSQDKLEVIGTQLALPGVASVVYPMQRC